MEDRPILLLESSFCGVGPKGKSPNNIHDHMMNSNYKFKLLFPLFRLTSSGKVLNLCLPGCRRVYKMLGPDV